MAATDTIDGRPRASVEPEPHKRIGGEAIANARVQLTSALRVFDRADTRLAHAHIAHAAIALDDALAELAS